MRTLILLPMLLFVAGCALQPVATGTIPPSAPTTTNNELISNQGGYRIAIPLEATLYQNQKPAVDGVLAPVPDTVAFQTENYIFALTHFVLTTETSVAQLIDNVSQCMAVTSDRVQPMTVGGVDYQTFLDAPCGPSSISFFYTVVDGRGYRITVEVNSPYQTFAEEIEAILASFVPTAAVVQAAGDVAATQSTDCRLPEPVQLAIERNPTATLDEMIEAVEIGWAVLSTIHRVAIVPVPGTETLGEPLLFVEWRTLSEETIALSTLWRVDGQWQQQTSCAAK